MIKLLIGGSPCTYWSVAQINGKNRRYGDEVRALEYAIDILEAVT